LRAVVIVASTRAATGVYTDTSGPILVSGLADLGFDVGDPVVVADGPDVAEALRRAVDDRVDVVLTSGGTGVTSTDRTPEATAELIDRPIPGIAETIRAYGAIHTPMAAISRGLAGIARRTLIVNLAGSTGAARDGLAVLSPIIVHTIQQLHDGDHEREDA